VRVLRRRAFLRAGGGGLMRFEPTPEQARAISTLAGELCISAGAGSGKTRVLAERFVAAVRPDSQVAGWEPADVGEVLSVTFTDKAAGEIAERVRRVLIEYGLIEMARRVDEAWISTIHGLCTRLLRTHALEAGLDPGFSVISTADAGALREEVLEDLLRDRIADKTAQRIVATYGVGAVFELVGALYDRLRAMGAAAADAAVEETPDPRQVLDAAGVAVRAWRTRLAEWPTPGVTLERIATSVADAEEELAALAATARIDGVAYDAGTTADLGRDVLGVLHRLTLKGNVGKAKDLLDECRAERHALIDRAVLTVAAPLERTLVALTDEFAERFDTAKAARSQLDYEDLQLKAVALLSADHGPAARYRALFRMVMVDEFQDTNEVQTRLADLLTDGDLCTVGDARQSIYSFRYADVDVYRRHTEKMIASGAATAELAANFRSHGDVLAFVNAVFGHPALFGDALLRLEHGRDEAAAPSPLPPGAPRVELMAVDNHDRSAAQARESEAEAVAGRLRALVDSGVHQGDIVVLLRAMTHADEYAAALARHDLDYTIVAGGSFFGRPEVEAVRAFLRVVANPLDDEALAHVLVSEMCVLSDAGLLRLRMKAGRGPLWLSVDEAALAPADRETVGAVKAAVEAAQSLEGRASVAEVVHRACEGLDYDLFLLTQGADGRRAYANVLKLARLAGEYERAGGAGTRGFLEHLALKERMRDREAPAAVIDERVDAVRVMTVHAAKGLEFPIVAVPELGRDLRADRGVLVLEKTPGGAAVALSLPDEDGSPAEERRSRWASDARERSREREGEEEKRLLYVACTRARELLVLSGATDLSKDATDRPIGWIRQALGSGLPERGERVIEVGDADARAKVAVRVILADEEAVEPPPPRPRPQATPTTPADPPTSAAGPPHAAPGTPPEVSHSAITTYEKCSLRYHAEKVLRIGSVRITSEGDPLRFGDAVHAALRLVGPAAEAPPADRIAAIARGWELGEGETVRLRAAVDGFLRSLACASAHAAGPPAREVPFAVPLAGLTLVGTIDLLAMGEDDALVVDYKTGEGAAGPDSAEGYRPQADAYALAALTGGAARVDVVFVGVETSELGAPREVSFRYEQADTSRLRATIEERARGPVAGPYAPLPRYVPGACDDCPAARGLCAVSVPAKRGR
jgi:ATP-dependent helicase/nuclease subunit A